MAPNAWPARLKALLRDMFSNPCIEVWNAGYSGQRLDNGWAFDNYDSAVINNPAYGTPHVCFIAFGLNDITGANIYENHKKQTLALCVKMISSGTLPILLTCDAFQSFNPPVRDSLRATQKIDGAKRAVSRQLGIPLLEVGEAQRKWASCNNSGYTWIGLQPDGLHFKNQGHAFKAGFIAAKMFPDLIVARDGLEVSARDPRWRLNPSLTWAAYTGSGAKSGATYYAAACAGQELMRGWIWNEDPELSLSCLWAGGGGSQATAASARNDLLDCFSQTTKTVQLSML